MTVAVRVLTRGRQAGAAAVEFALLLPVLLLATAISVDLGRITYQHNVLQKAVREPARYLSRQLPGPTPTDNRYGGRSTYAVATDMAQAYCRSLGVPAPCLSVVIEDSVAPAGGPLAGNVGFGAGQHTLVRVTVSGYTVKTQLVGAILTLVGAGDVLLPSVSATFVQG